MSVDKRTSTIWEIEFLKCQTKNQLRNYISKYVNETENPYVDMAKAKLQTSTFAPSNDNLPKSNWVKDNMDIIPKILIFVFILVTGYFIEEGYSNWKTKRNAELHRAQMETLLRQQEERNRIFQAWNKEHEERVAKINKLNEEIVESKSNSISSSYTQSPYHIDYEPFIPYNINSNEIMTLYDTEVASRQTPQEFLNERMGAECKSCHGTKKCPACNGSHIASGLGNTYVCHLCNETGDCPACGGTGLASWNR